MIEELTEKYRPKDFDEVVGQDSVIESLKSILSRTEGIPHGFLFTGPHGCGKTTLAFICKEKMKCGERDFHYYNTSNTRGIDTIREIDTQCRYKPLSGPVKFYVLDECHKLTNEAQNALLTLLERPPRHAYFALCTTDPEKLLPTVKSRCVPFTLKSLKRMEILHLVKGIANKEKVDFPPKIYSELSRVANGSPRDAIKRLDAIIDIPTDEEALKAISEGIVGEADTIDICRELISNDGVTTKWKIISDIVKKVDPEPESLRLAILGYLNVVLLNNPADKIANLIELFSESTYSSGKAGMSLMLYLGCKL